MTPAQIKEAHRALGSDRWSQKSSERRVAGHAVAEGHGLVWTAHGVKTVEKITCTYLNLARTKLATTAKPPGPGTAGWDDHLWQVWRESAWARDVAICECFKQALSTAPNDAYTIEFVGNRFTDAARPGAGASSLEYSEIRDALQKGIAIAARAREVCGELTH